MSKAKRDNAKKPRLGYVLEFPHAIEMLSRVMEYGANKYGERNWAKGGKPDREYIDAALRHQLAGLNGQDHDKESHCAHLGHMLWNVLALIEMNYPDLPATVPGFEDACEAAYAARMNRKRLPKLPAAATKPGKVEHHYQFPSPYEKDEGELL